MPAAWDPLGRSPARKKVSLRGHSRHQRSQHSPLRIGQIAGVPFARAAMLRAGRIRPHGGLLRIDATTLKSQQIHRIQEVSKPTLSRGHRRRLRKGPRRTNPQGPLAFAFSEGRPCPVRLQTSDRVAEPLAAQVRVDLRSTRERAPHAEAMVRGPLREKSRGHTKPPYATHFAAVTALVEAMAINRPKKVADRWFGHSFGRGPTRA